MRPQVAVNGPARPKRWLLTQLPEDPDFKEVGRRATNQAVAKFWVTFRPQCLEQGMLPVLGLAARFVPPHEVANRPIIKNGRMDLFGQNPATQIRKRMLASQVIECTYVQYPSDACVRGYH